jgi:predicted ATPase
MASNGESALDLFESRIDKNMICLLDEPENSLSAIHQKDLAQYISDSARFFDCQFIIATHSPFILSIKGATVYDLDAYPVCVKKWTDLNSIKEYSKLFKDIK